MSSRLYPAEGVGNGGIALEKSPLPALRNGSEDRSEDGSENGSRRRSIEDGSYQ
ncbi:MAG: hypothetical protein V1715_12380 [bacterium]